MVKREGDAVRIELELGRGPDRAAEEMVRRAIQLNRQVLARFNGIELSAYPTSSEAEVELQWYKAAYSKWA